MATKAPKARRPTKRQLESLREEMEAEREKLLAQVRQIEADFNDTSWSRPRFDDEVESGGVIFERERMMALLRNARMMAAQIDDALERMDAGTYGLCQSCGQPIHPDRLKALPQAVQCVECRRRDERIVR